MFRRSVLLLIVFLVAACGKRGDPRPPVPVIPQATTDLAITQRAGEMILSWSYPSLTTAGRSLTAIQRISIYRYVEEFPTSAFDRDAMAMGEKIDDTPRAITLFSSRPTLPQAQFEKLSEKIVSIERANLPEVSSGGRLLFTDTPPFQTTDGRPVRLHYAVVTEGESARSQPSNLAIIVPLPVAVPPPVLRAAVNAEGVTLSWDEPKTSVTGQTPEISGYHIYRAAPGTKASEFTNPINNAPVKSTTYTDVPPYGEHEYRVTAVASTGPPLIQSEVSAPAVAGFRDLLPPPPPATITPLLELNAIRLIWDPVDASDLAGYRLYRTEGAGHTNIREVGTIPVVVQPIPDTTFLHTPVTLGIAFRYAVTAVDKSGNESARTWSGWVVAPKTP